MTTTVKSASRRVLRVAGISVFLLLSAGFIAPLINAAHYSSRIREALEASLQRKVEFGEVHFAFFTGFGFSLEAVTIHEDPRFGIEPFAYVPTLEARLRIDKLLLGHIQFSSLRLVEPSLNLVKGRDGAWNIAELLERLAGLRPASLNLFPALEVSGGRVDFKLGTRKTTLYIADADISIYPEPLGKLYFRFAGSPARTDRAGNGFGHLHGTANWYLIPQRTGGNQLEADVILDPSNLSEITTLLEGYDVGIHGVASAHARIDGPATALRLSGDLRLEDVHRWDLLPAAGGQWRIRCDGKIDLLGRTFSLEATPWRPNDATQVALAMRVNNFLARPTWSVLARVRNTPSENMLPFFGRMGIPSPEGLALGGTVDGAVGYSNRSGLAGGLIFNDLVVTLPGRPPLHAGFTTATISPDSIRFDPAVIQEPSGTLQVTANYYPSTRRAVASLRMGDYPVEAFTSAVGPWLTAPSALSALQKGNLTGQLLYTNDGTEPVLWSGQFDFANATLVPPGLAVPLTESSGRITFDHSTFTVHRFSGSLEHETVRGEYHYTAFLKHPERLHLQLSSADLSQIEVALDPTLRAQGLLARLRFGQRTIPVWLAKRNLEADIAVRQFSVNGASLGTLQSHLVWQGTTVNFNSLQLNLPEGLVSGHGTLNLATYSPQYQFAVTVNDLPWRGGVLNADGTFETSGTDLEALRNLRASGNFSGEDLSLSPDDVFSKLSGLFDLSFEDGWPNLRLSKVEASQGDEAWIGEAASQSDGKLILDLESAGRQRRVISSLQPAAPSVSSEITNTGPQ
jgi:hypothetical protein